MVVFGIPTRGDLQNELFCVQEERDYFQSKYLEQVSEIRALKEELKKSKKEIRRLRTFLMDSSDDHVLNVPLEHIATTPKTASATESSDRSRCEKEGRGVGDDDDLSHVAEKDDD